MQRRPLEIHLLQIIRLANRKSKYCVIKIITITSLNDSLVTKLKEELKIIIRNWNFRYFWI